MDKIYLGRRWNPRTGRTGRRVTYDLRSHLTLFGTTGCGKGATLEIPNLLRGLRRMSVVSIDPSGQNAAVTAAARRRAGRHVLMLNPFNLHVAGYPDMQDVGFNPLTTLDPAAPAFFEIAASLGDAMISVEGDSQIHFPNSARGLMTWLMMYVRLRDGDRANLGTVRDLLTGDLPATAEDAVAAGHPGLASLAWKYQKESKELEGVISTAETQSRWLLSDVMRASLAKNGVDFGRLKERPTTVFLILPAGRELETHGVWLRLAVTSALNALYARIGGTPTLFMLSEFAQLGKLASITAALGQGRKYGIRLWPVLQNMGQLRDIYGPQNSNTFIANSGCVVSFCAGDGDTAEWMSAFSGEQGVVGMSASADPHAPGGVRINYNEQRERVWAPGKTRELPEFHGLVWQFGKAEPQPVYCPPYWKIGACRRRARPDPYHPQAAGGGLHRRLRRVVRLAAGAALAAAVVVGIAWLRAGIG